MRRLHPWIAACAAVLSLTSAHAKDPQPRDEVEQVAYRYLAALTGEGDGAGRELLLGGATMNAQLFSLENWRVVKREPARKEQGDLASAKRRMAELDRAGREALTRLLAEVGEQGGGGITEVSEAQASRLLAPTRVKAKAFQDQHPVLAYVARVGKELYWHPQNPLRPVLARAGDGGSYTVELHRFEIETREGPRQVPRVWPLRVVRLKSDTLDTGWKILPASDWNAE